MLVFQALRFIKLNGSNGKLLPFEFREINVVYLESIQVDAIARAFLMLRIMEDKHKVWIWVKATG